MAVDWSALVGRGARKQQPRQMTDILFLSEDERALVHAVLQRGRMPGPAAFTVLPNLESDAVQGLLDQLVAGGYLSTEGEDDTLVYTSHLSSRPGRSLSANIWQVLYEQIADVFDSEGKKIAVEGNHPLDLSDDHSVWLVRTGSVNVFAVEFSRERPMGRRRFLFNARVGDSVFGVRRGSSGFGLIAMGNPGTSLTQLPIERMIELTSDARYRRQVAGMLDTWIRSLEPDSAAMPPQSFMALPIGEQVTLPPGAFGRPPEGEVSWIRVFAGQAVISTLEERAPQDRCVPVTDRAWISADDNVRLATTSTEQWLEDTRDWGDLAAYHRTVLDHYVVRRDRDEARERDRLRRRSAGDQALVSSAVVELGSLFVPPGQAKLGRLEGQDPWLAALQLAAEAGRVEWTLSPRTEIADADPWQRMEHAARQAGVRVRRVVLRGRWWKDDLGAVVAVRTDRGTPVAVVSEQGRVNWVIDPASGSRERLTEALAAVLSTAALMVVRPFGARIIRPLDLARFGALGLKRDFGTVLVLSLLTGLLALLTPVFTGKIFGQIIPGAERGQLWEVVFALTGAAVATALFQATRGVALVRIEGRMDGSIESAVWDRILDLPVPFFSKYTAGDLVARAMGINAMRQVLTGSMLSSVLTGVFSLFSFGLLFYYNGTLAISATILALVFVAVNLMANLRQVRLQRRLLAIEGRLSGMVLQFVSGIAKLRVAGAESRAFARWAEEYRAQQTLMVNGRQIRNTLSTIMAMFTVISSMVLFWVVSRLGSGIGVGTFLGFNAAYGQFVGSLMGLGSAVMGAVQVVPLYERAAPILTTYPEVDQTKADPGELTGEIEISHVSFRYQNDGPWILRDVSVHARPGEFIAFVGSSGSGKSTMMRLLLNFATPQQGAIYFDGEDLQSLDPRAVRRKIGVVLQNGQLIQGDIFSNIVGASSSLTVDDAWEAARLVGLDEDIRRMPMGMQTYLSVGGGTLSGGQRQRILIARAIVHRPRILLFDEATSALDNRTQAIISKSVEQLRATRIVIAHRLSTIINADRIYVIDHGQVVQTGMYEELADAPGLFQELIKRQLA